MYWKKGSDKEDSKHRSLYNAGLLNDNFSENWETLDKWERDDGASPYTVTLTSLTKIRIDTHNASVGGHCFFNSIKKLRNLYDSFSTVIRVFYPTTEGRAIHFGILNGIDKVGFQFITGTTAPTSGLHLFLPEDIGQIAPTTNLTLSSYVYLGLAIKTTPEKYFFYYINLLTTIGMPFLEVGSISRLTGEQSVYLGVTNSTTASNNSDFFGISPIDTL